MMHRFISLSALAALSLIAVPNVTAQENEYMGPEEVYYQQAPALSQIPRGRRAAEANAARQAEERQSRLYGSSSSATTATVGEGDDVTTNLHDAAPDDEEFDIENGGGVVIEGTSDDALDWLGNSLTTLHSGADTNEAIYNDLPGTGPAVILVGIVLAGAAGWTLWRARRMSR